MTSRPPALGKLSVLKRHLALVLVLILAVLHQDFFFAADPTLLFGFLPVGLAYHSLFCAAVSAMWLVVIRYAWPTPDA